MYNYNEVAVFAVAAGIAAIAVGITIALMFKRIKDLTQQVKDRDKIISDDVTERIFNELEKLAMRRDYMPMYDKGAPHTTKGVGIAGEDGKEWNPPVEYNLSKSPKVECKEWCGLNHCDTNGCSNRVRHSVPITDFKDLLKAEGDLAKAMADAEIGVKVNLKSIDQFKREMAAAGVQPHTPEKEELGDAFIALADQLKDYLPKGIEPIKGGPTFNVVHNGGLAFGGWIEGTTYEQYIDLLNKGKLMFGVKLKFTKRQAASAISILYFNFDHQPFESIDWYILNEIEPNIDGGNCTKDDGGDIFMITSKG